MAIQRETRPKARLFYLDNMRIYLTVLVILHHAAIGYGGAGDWAIQETPTDGLSPILLVLFNAVNQSYFMSAFFLLAGYFTPRSFAKKGAKSFLGDRLIRLGIPILVYTTLLINVNSYILDVFVRRVPFHWRVEYNPGHLWFLQALLLFAALYAVWVIFKRPSASNPASSFFTNAFPSDKVLVISIGLLTILTFLVRIVFPVGQWVFNFQLAHFVHYIFSFSVGVLAYRGDWFGHLSSTQARRWGWVALAVIPLFIVLFVLGGVAEDEANVVNFLGGFTWQSFTYVLWESILCIAINLFLLYFFRENLNWAGAIAKTMAASVFTVYIIHQTLLYAAQAMLLPLSLPTILKFFVVALLVAPLCFWLSIPIRKLPYAERLLG